MILRPIRPTDLAHLVDLDQRCFPPGIAYAESEIREVLRPSARGFHLVCEAPDAKLLGFILTLPRRDRGHVVTVDVEPGRRRQGVGHILMESAEDYYRKHGARGMRLEVAVNNVPGLRFYAGLGYRVVRLLTGYYAADLDGLLLHKDWTPDS